MQYQPVTTQPGIPAQHGGNWMQAPPTSPNIPLGLEYLTMLDRIGVHQVKDTYELLAGVEIANRYALKNANGQQAYFALEESECCERQMCGPQRGFTMRIIDNYRREVLTIHRDFHFLAGACGGLMAGNEVTITSPSNGLLGSVRQRSACCATKLDVLDADGNRVLWIDGPTRCFRTCRDFDFPIKTPDNQEIGSITKKWGGLFKEAFTDADTFQVSFPADLDVKVKSVLVGATFLIDFMEFETASKKDHRLDMRF